VSERGFNIQATKTGYIYTDEKNIELGEMKEQKNRKVKGRQKGK